MILYLTEEILKGKSLLRALMNRELSGYQIGGQVLDIGGGVNPSYLRFLQIQDGTSFTNVDFKSQSGVYLDLESSALPFPDQSADVVLMFNILEHIYNYNFLLDQVKKVLKPGGRVIGFVPFLVNYHPDPHDYFRYTQEALQKIFTGAGLNIISIKALGYGPFAVNFNNLILSLPRWGMVLLLPLYYLLDQLFLALRPGITARYPLGYIFVLNKT